MYGGLCVRIPKQVKEELLHPNNICIILILQIYPYICVVVCNHLWGKELHRQVGVVIVMTSGKPTWCNGSTLSWNARDVGSSPAVGTVFPIFITPMAFTHIWRAVFQNTISANPKIEFAMPMPSSKIMFWKTALHKYAHIYAYIYIYIYVKSVFPKHNLRTWYLHYIFWNGAYRTLEPAQNFLAVIPFWALLKNVVRTTLVWQGLKHYNILCCIPHPGYRLCWYVLLSVVHFPVEPL